MSSTYDIDFVVLWVDGGDEEWLKEKSLYRPVGDDRVARYRDWDIFHYWFRGVEKFAPWVRRVHFVTWGHLPPWLNTENPKLHIVNHKDYLPDEYRPCFNSNALEMNLHRIEGLSEHFVAFNDDMHIIKPVKPTDYFVDGKPVDMLALQPVIANPNDPAMSHILFNNAMVLCKYFDKRECMKKMPGKFFNLKYPFLYFGYNLLETVFPMFTGFYDSHSPAPLLLRTYRELWEKEGELLDMVSKNRFRAFTDISLYTFRAWERLNGNFHPRNMNHLNAYIDVSRDDAAKKIKKTHCPMVCINDVSKDFDFDKRQHEISEALRSILPDKCSFEK